MHYAPIMSNRYVKADWPAPTTVQAYTTTRQCINPPQSGYDYFNLATHVDDARVQVEKNRQQLQQELALPTTPTWLTQTHSNHVLTLTTEPFQLPPVADGSTTCKKNVVCAVLTADCLPIALCNETGTEVAIIHAGWRGLYKKIIENTINAMTTPPEKLMAWLGPAISVKAYQVGQTLRTQFLQQHPHVEPAFVWQNNDWNLDLYALAKLTLTHAGVCAHYGGTHCTYTETELFYSHRREGPHTGRMATLIWLADNV